MEEETEFSAEDLSLATVPGLEFDPKERSFELDELRPQPIIKKRRKLFTKDSNKVMKVQYYHINQLRPITDSLGVFLMCIASFVGGQAGRLKT